MALDWNNLPPPTQKKDSPNSPVIDDRCPCCQKFSIRWLYFMNGLVLLSAIVLLSITIFLAVASGDLVEAIGEVGILGPVISGSILLLVAIIGCIGVVYKKKWVIAVYLLLTAAAASAFLGAGILLTFLAKDLNNIDGADSETFAGKVEGRLNDFVVAVFNQCCFEQFSDDIIKLLACDDPQANQEACFTFVDDYEAALERVKSTGLCDILEKVEVDGFPVVGDPNLGGCAGGDGVLFKQVMGDFVEDALVPIGITFIVLGTLLLITILSSIVLLCVRKKEILGEENYAKVDVGSYAPITYGINTVGLNQSQENVNPKYKNVPSSYGIGF